LKESFNTKNIDDAQILVNDNATLFFNLHEQERVIQEVIDWLVKRIGIGIQAYGLSLVVESKEGRIVLSLDLFKIHVELIGSFFEFWDLVFDEIYKVKVPFSLQGRLKITI